MTIYLIGFLSQVDGVGPKNFFWLVKLFGSAKKVWTSKMGEFGEKKAPKLVKEAIFEARNKVDPTAILTDLNKKMFK